MTSLALLDQFRDCPVLVVGDFMLDEFIWGQVSRISPEAPVPVVEVQRRSFIAGGAANTAANVASLGGRALVVGLVGEDPEGDRVLDLLRTGDIDVTGLLRQADRPTSTKTRVVAHSQQVVRIDREVQGPITAAQEALLLDHVRTALPSVGSVVVSDYGKGVVTECLVQGVIESARAAGIPVIVDPKGTAYGKYRGAALIKPNQLEAGRVLNRDLRTREDVQAAGMELLHRLGPDSSILITRGPHGMALFEPGRPMVEIPAQAREVYDVTGAGDTVAGAIALALACRGPLTTACQLASLAAAIVVGKVGTATCSWDELRRAAE